MSNIEIISDWLLFSFSDNRTYTMALTNDTHLPVPEVSWIEVEEEESWGCDPEIDGDCEEGEGEVKIVSNIPWV